MLRLRTKCIYYSIYQTEKTKFRRFRPCHYPRKRQTIVDDFGIMEKRLHYHSSVPQYLALQMLWQRV